MAADDWFPADVFEDEPWLEEEQDASEAARMNWGGGRSRRPERYVVHENVEFLDSTAKAVKVKFPGGRVRFIPLGQMPRNFDWEVGKVGDLEVTEWFDEKLSEEADEPVEEEVEVQGVTVLRESERALRVRWGSSEEWFPKGQIRSRSECQHDGDRGLLVVTRWIAEQKGMVEAREKVERPGTDVAQDVRAGDARQKDMFDEYFPPPAEDDDIPF